MENTLPQATSTSERGPVKGTGATPFSQHTVVRTKPADIARTWQAHSWQAQYERLVERDAALKADVAALQATIRALTQRLSGAKSEPSAGPDSAGVSPATSPRKRGQQPGSPGPGRRERAALPVVAAVHDVRDAAQHCPVCGEALRPVPGAAESTMLAVHVQAQMRRIQRQRSHKTCQCSPVPGLVTAPPAPRVIPQSPLGVSGWTMGLLDTDLSGRPTHRFCEEWRPDGRPLAHGTRTEGWQSRAGRCEPLRQALQERQMGEKLFHGDETRWAGCAEGEGKTGHRW
jgi:transposase